MFYLNQIKEIFNFLFTKFEIKFIKQNLKNNTNLK